MKKFLTLFVLVCPLLALAQQTRQITGQVLDRADGAPLVGATVFIAPEETQAKDYNPQGTIAYEQGRFAFKLPASVRKVVVSYLGYEARTLDISGKSDFTIYLSASDNKVDAVVVTGYQRIEKRKLTSSISSVKMSDISRDGVASVDEMLSGSIAGLVSTPTSGGPGAASKIKIRSTVTLNGNTDPLWVLDGMPLEGNDIPKDWSSKESVDNLYNMSIAGLNPWDIEDITVLKDAAATAIYGARAANGVIIITTKKGLRNQAMRVNVSASLFVTDRPDLSRLNLMNASQKVDLELGLAANARLNYLPGMGGVARILDKAGERPALVNGGSLASLSPETQSAIGALRRNGTDWGREIYRTALNQQYSVSISGGSGKTGYYFSGGYYNEQGTTVGTGFERLNLTMKTDYDLLQNLRFGASVFVGQNKNDSYLSDTDVFTNPSRYTRTVNPYLNAYNPELRVRPRHDGQYGQHRRARLQLPGGTRPHGVHAQDPFDQDDFRPGLPSGEGIETLHAVRPAGRQLRDRENGAGKHLLHPQVSAQINGGSGSAPAERRRNPELERRPLAVQLESAGRICGHVRRKA